MEGVRPRVKDSDFACQQITVHAGKGAQDRLTMLPHTLVAPLQRHLARVKLRHEEDLLEGSGAPWPSRCQYDHDLHVCLTTRREGRAESS